MQKELIVDLHIHSRYSRATSSSMNLDSLYHWGKIKGINVIGTGDFTHPLWYSEILEKLEPAENGLLRLKTSLAKKEDKSIAEILRKNTIRFVPTVEISTIFKKLGRVRKLHNIIVAPNLESISAIAKELQKRGNLHSDGRPILGMDSKDLLMLVMDINSSCMFIPAHIWTPWFSLFGSQSGFDRLTDAFGEMTKHISALETGLSSDPFMNRQLSQLDGITLVSNYDAHSPQKLGREANILNCRFDYQEISNAIKSGDERFVGTIEFFPEEGKYHYDGHRLCNVRLSPQETKKLKGGCPKCGKPLTVGVDHRVFDLSDRPENRTAKKKVEYIIPLTEIVAELKGIKSTNSKRVTDEYEKITNLLGDEFSILRKIPLKEIKDKGFPELSLAINKMRKKEVSVEPGYDGVYGKISVLS